MLAIHNMLLAQHGGAVGIRGYGLFRDAISSIRNGYLGGPADSFRIAAATAHALVRNPPFNDGNKGMALALSGVFLELGGFRLVAPEANAVVAIVALSEGALDEGAFADWLTSSCEALPPRP